MTSTDLFHGVGTGGPMSISSDAVFPHVSPIFDRTFLAVARGGKRFFNFPDRTFLHARTIASIVNDAVFNELVGELDGVPGIRPHNINPSSQRFISVNDLLLLWIKRLDEQHMTANILTAVKEDMLDQQAVFPFMPEATLIVLGYRFDPETMDLRSVSFQPASRYAPDWYIDLEPGDTGIVEMPMAKNPKPRPSGLKITRYEKKKLKF